MGPDERDAAHLWDMLQAAREVEDMIANRSMASVLEDRVRLRAIERVVELIGEAARRVSEAYAAKHLELHWR